MPTIKNTDELVKRARNHLEADRFLQGEYVKAKSNGEVEFQGCAIGCLVMDVDLKTLKELRPQDGFKSGVQVESPLIGSTYVEPWDEWDEDDHNWALVFNGSQRMIETLEEQFGIPRDLMLWAERAFEDGTQRHRESGEWVVSFAEALAPLEGVEITNAEVEEAWIAATRQDTTIREDVLGFLEEKAAAVPA